MGTFPNKETQFKSGKEAVKNGRKGGVASGMSKRHAKTVREALIELMKMKDETGATGAERIALALFNKGLTGDAAALKLAGEWLDELRKKVDLNTDQPFQVKVIEATEEMSTKISDYLNG